MATSETRTWEQLKEEAFRLYKEKKYDAAIKVTLRSLELARKIYGPEDLKVAEASGNLGALYGLAGQPAKQKEFAEKARAIRKKHGGGGVPLGIETEAFFDEVGKRKAELQQRPGASQVQYAANSGPYCDLNGDGRCDAKDEALFQALSGQCASGNKNAGTIIELDFDGDGCVKDPESRIFRNEMKRHRQAP